MPEITYLHIRGILAESMVYQPRPGYESPRPGRRAEGDPAYQLVLLDREDRLLLSVAPQVTARGCGSVNDPLRYRVRGVLPLHPDGATYELRRDEVRLYRAAIPPVPPAAPVPRHRSDGSQVTLDWQAGEQPDDASGDTAPDGDAPGATTRRLTYSVVAAMESGRRITVARGLTEPTHKVDLSLMPVHGKGKLYLVASDGVRSAEVEAASIDVPERAPTVHILAPAPDSRLPFGQPVSVLGCCLDMGGSACTPELAVWSLDGERFAAGTLVAALDGLNPGTHRLTLAYEAGDMGPVEASTAFEVEEPDEDYRQWEALIGNE
jgi:hypothetical protein